MNISKLEKNLAMLGLILIVVWVSLISIGMYQVNKAGGFKQIFIEAGKDMKDISAEVDKHQTKQD